MTEASSAPIKSKIENGADKTCVLMFSGGRDSTLAAVRLYHDGYAPVLVTITSGHLTGLSRVEQRLRELSRVIPETTPWIVVRQPHDLKTDTSFYEQTCLPCHHAYVVASARIGQTFEARTLAFGYARYQGDWPEQSPIATESLRAVLRRHDIELLLPVYDIASKEEAISELLSLSLSTDSLEQKCSRQVTNVALSPEKLIQQVQLWEQAIEGSMAVAPQIPITIELQTVIGRVR